MKNSIYIIPAILSYLIVCFALLSFRPHKGIKVYKSDIAPTTTEVIRKKEQDVNVLESKANVLIHELQQ